MKHDYRGYSAGIFGLAVSLSATALAQSGTWTWQISTDTGASWTEGSVHVPATQESVLLRVVFSWRDLPGAYALASTQFDAIRVGLDGAGPGDTVRNLVRPGALGSGEQQTIVSTRFGDTIKMDDSRDTSGPGFGLRGIFPSQPPEFLSGGNFTSANPVSLFEYELVLDGSLGERLISDVPMAVGEDTLVVKLFTSPQGSLAQLRNGMFMTQIQRSDARVIVVPAPVTWAGLTTGLALTARRRRAGV